MRKRGMKDGELVSLLAASGAMSEDHSPSIVLIAIASVTGISIAALVLRRVSCLRCARDRPGFRRAVARRTRDGRCVDQARTVSLVRKTFLVALRRCCCRS
jgi:hypothetical protein